MFCINKIGDLMKINYYNTFIRQTTPMQKENNKQKKTISSQKQNDSISFCGAHQGLIKEENK